MCTSEDGSNAACEEGAADLPHGECSAAYGDDFCAVLVTKNKVSAALAEIGGYSRGFISSLIILFINCTRQKGDERTRLCVDTAVTAHRSLFVWLVWSCQLAGPSLHHLFCVSPVWLSRYPCSCHQLIMEQI